MAQFPTGPDRRGGPWWLALPEREPAALKEPAGKIAVTAAEPSMDAAVDPQFGRCPYLILVDKEGDTFEILKNSNTARGNAGVQAAEMIAAKGAKVLLTGKCGPSASGSPRRRGNSSCSRMFRHRPRCGQTIQSRKIAAGQQERGDTCVRQTVCNSKTRWLRMTRYLSRLSRAQIVWLAGSLVAAVAVCGIGAALEPRGRAEAPPLTTAMTLRQMAPRLDTTGKALARELDLPLEVSKDKAVVELGVSQETLDATAAHLSSHHDDVVKYFVFAAIVLWGLVFLVRLGRPDGATATERKTWYPRAPYIVSLLLAVAVAGFALGKSTQSDGRGRQGIQGDGGIAALGGGDGRGVRLLHRAGDRGEQTRLRLGLPVWRSSGTGLIAFRFSAESSVGRCPSGAQIWSARGYSLSCS